MPPEAQRLRLDALRRYSAAIESNKLDENNTYIIRPEGQGRRRDRFQVRDMAGKI